MKDYSARYAHTLVIEMPDYPELSKRAIKNKISQSVQDTCNVKPTPAELSILYKIYTHRTIFRKYGIFPGTRQINTQKKMLTYHLATIPKPILKELFKHPNQAVLTAKHASHLAHLFKNGSLTTHHIQNRHIDGILL